MIALNAEQQDKLVRLLNKALDFSQLADYVYLGTGDRLFDEFVEKDLPKRPMIAKVIAALELGPVTDKFLRVVYREKPLQTELRAYIAELYPEIPAASDKAPRLVEFQKAGVTSEAPSAGPALERIVKKSLPFLDTQVWLNRFELLKRQVCRVELNGQPLGTGFLVGPSAVLTNWHVAHAAGADVGKLACRFDYQRRLDGGEDAGVVIAVASIPAQHPCSQAELSPNPDNPPPTANELDYALLALATPVAERGFVRLAETPPAPAGAPLIIVQHPNGEPMRFAMDTDAVIGFVHDGLRLRYRTNTLPGSSGSPCFTMNWDLLALHHLGDPANGAAPFNQGVPIGLIAKSIAADGASAWLGA